MPVSISVVPSGLSKASPSLQKFGAYVSVPDDVVVFKNGSYNNKAIENIVRDLRDISVAGVCSAIIGGLAFVKNGFPKPLQDIDVIVPVSQLSDFKAKLILRGYKVFIKDDYLISPYDGWDGVINLMGDLIRFESGDEVQLDLEDAFNYMDLRTCTTLKLDSNRQRDLDTLLDFIVRATPEQLDLMRPKDVINDMRFEELVKQAKDIKSREFI